MIDLGPNAPFIVSAYIGVFAMLALLIGITLISALRAKKALRRLEAATGRSRAPGQ